MPPTYEFVQVVRILACGVKSTMGLRLPEPMTPDEAKLWVSVTYGNTQWRFKHVSTVDIR